MEAAEQTMELHVEQENGSVPKLSALGKSHSFPADKTTSEETSISSAQMSSGCLATDSDWNIFCKCFAKDMVLKKGGGGEATTDRFLQEVMHILLLYLERQADPLSKVLDFHQPHTLRDILDLELGAPRDLEQILSDCKEALKYSVKSGHPRFFNQLSQGLDTVSLAGEWLTSTANCNMFTYEVAPVFSLMEQKVLRRMTSLVGWPEGDGMFCPGGAISNLTALLLARHFRYPETKKQGMWGLPRLLVFASQHAHYSAVQAATIIGLGTDSVVQIKTDSRGKMDLSDLKKQLAAAIARGEVPLALFLTASTTVLGAVDPIQHAAALVKPLNIWLHVDGAWGGGILFSEKHRHLLRGIDRADSVTINPHKLMGVTLQCSVVLTKHKGLLEATNSIRATYLFQQDKHYDVSYDTGDKSVQCGRRNDVFKLWLLWRASGDAGFEARVDYLFDLARYAVKSLQQRSSRGGGFELVAEPETLNVCFWYIPRTLRRLPAGEARNAQLHQIAPKIKAAMMLRGSTMIGYQPLDKLPNFFRLVCSNPQSTTSDVDFLLDEIARLGEEVA